MRNIIERTLKGLLITLFCVACSSEEPTSPQDPTFAGAWGFQSVDAESGIRVYSRLDSLTGDQVGYFFGPDGFLLIRNSGWCGTPPLSYSNLEGTWEEEHENNLLLKYPRWDWIRDSRLVIISLSAQEMRCRVDDVQ
jgi:hypothetical protein